MKKINLLFLAVIALWSCSNSTSTSTKYSDRNFDYMKIPETIDSTNINKHKISDYYKKIDGFEIDMTGGPIGRVDKVNISGTLLFVLDTHFAKKLFVYDIESGGDFLFSIGAKGKGSGEFLRISDFSIDEKNNQILILDMQLKKLCYFNFQGEYLRESKLSFTPLKVGVDDKYLYFICNTYKKDDCGLKILNKNHELIGELFPYDDYPTFSNYECGFYNSHDNLLLNYPNCDTVFHIDGIQLSPYLVLETKNKSYKSYVRETNILPEERVFFNRRNIKDKRFSFKDIIIPFTYFEDNKIKTFSFMENEQYYRCLNSKNQSSVSSSLGYIVDDISGFPINFRFYNREYGTINIVSPRALIKAKFDILDKNKKRIGSKLLEDIRTADVDCNPFVLFYN